MRCIDGCDYWDGVFAQNPPIRELPDLVRTLDGEPPEEIWVIRVNPVTRATVPGLMVEIRDRRNELGGIISLSQELYFIDFLNWLVDKGELPDKHRRIELRSIRMSDEFAAGLDYDSKRDRSPRFLQRLQEHGMEQAEAFLRDPEGHREPSPYVECTDR